MAWVIFVSAALTGAGVFVTSAILFTPFGERTVVASESGEIASEQAGFIKNVAFKVKPRLRAVK